MEKIEKVFNYRLTSTRGFLLLLLGYVLSYYKLMSSNYLFNDDQGRKYAGYHGWLDWSRWTDTVLSNFIHTDTFLYDIAPLTQIIACCILAAASLIAIQVIFESKRITVIGAIAGLIIGVNPYLIGCYVYKYDCPYMAISILSSIAPLYYWSFAKEENIIIKRAKYLVVSIIGVLIMLTSYQSSAGIYPMIVIVVVMKSLFQNDDIAKILDFILLSIFGYIISAILFVKVLAMHRSDSGNWAMVSSAKDVIYNYQSHYISIFQDYKSIWNVAILVLIFMLICLYTVKYHGNKIRGFAYCIIAIFGNSFVAFGANIILDCKGLDLLIAKYLYGVNAGICFLVLLLIWILLNEMESSNKCQMITKVGASIITCCLMYCFVVFTYIYGNCLETQWNYHLFRVEEVVNDLTDLDIMMNGKDKDVSIVGGIGLSPVLKNYPDTKLIRKLLPQSFSEISWGEFYFRYYYSIPNMRTPESKFDSEELSRFTLVQESVYHNIFLNEESSEVVIVLNNPEQNKWKE